jgi:predicted anti-sigma-YlaC factor YlaD
MFNNHVTKQLSAYHHGELDAARSRRVAEHLIGCERCRKQYDEIKLGIHLAERLPQVSAPDSMWGEIEALLDEQARRAVARPSPTWSVFSFAWYKVAIASAALAVVAAVGVVWYYNYGPRASWAFEVLAGAPMIDSDRIVGTGRIAEGEMLVTDDKSRVRVEVGLIGEIEIEENSRIRLVDASFNEHRIALEHGRLEAKISAPPRLFFVDTPSAEAIDLGCAYTLEVDDRGRSFLHVTKGWVALVRDGRESYVPIGAMCETRPGVGPGTPYFANASDTLKDALERLDFENGGDEALAVVLAESRDKDTYTLWHLLSRVEGERRERVMERMIELVGLPDGVTREGILKLDKDMLELWKDEMDVAWFQ